MKNLNLPLRGLWDDVQSSLWFRPGLIALLALLLALVTPYVDQSTKLKFYAIGADNARAVLSAIASSMLTVVTLTFSILMVALTLTSQQFSPRVLRSFTSNHTAQNILGILIGAFLYSLLVLVTVIDTSDTTFVPLLSVLVAIAYAVIGIGAFIYFIDHIAKNIRVSYIIYTINEETVTLLHASELEQVGGNQKHIPLSDPLLDRHQATRVNARHAGYIQAIDTQRLAVLAQKQGYTIQIVGMTGDFVAKGRPLLYVWNRSALQNHSERQSVEADRNAVTEAQEGAEIPDFEIPSHVATELVQQFDIGVERTMFEDVLFGIRQLVDIALKALSPGINDPTTAVNCLHYLENILIHAAHSADQQISYYDEEGNLSLIGRTVTFGTMVDLAFHQLRHYGCDDPTIALQLLSMLTNVAQETEDQERRNQLWHHALLIRERVNDQIRQKADRDLINNHLLQLSRLLSQTYDTISLDSERFVNKLG